MSETMHGTPHIFCATPSKISTAGRWSGTTSDGPGQVQAGDAPDSRNYICVTSIVLLHYRSADPRACVPGGCAGVKTPRFSVLRGLTRRRGHGLDYSRRKDFGFGGGGVRSRTENPAYLLHFSRRAPLHSNGGGWRARRFSPVVKRLTCLIDARIAPPCLNARRLGKCRAHEIPQQRRAHAGASDRRATSSAAS